MAGNFSYAQNGQKWSEDGNSVTSSSFLGTINNFPLNIRVNNTEWFRISPVGAYTFHSLNGNGNGLMFLDNTGTVSRLNFTGSSSQVLLGNGTFGSLSNITGWFTQPGLVYTNGKVGINGLSNPNEALEVNGNGIFNGNVSAQQVLVGDVVNSGKSLRINNSLCMKGYDPNVQGSRSELCAMGHHFFIQSTSGLNFNTIINHANSGNVGIGTDLPSEKLEVTGNVKVSGQLFTSEITTSRIASTDTVIRFGDSTMYIYTLLNRIHWDPTNWNIPLLGTVKGFALGNSIGFGTESIAIGNKVFTGNNSDKSISIGSGSNTMALSNGIPNSLMVGFNSNVPSLFVGPSIGNNQTGNVGISTTTPEEKLQINSEFKKLAVGDAFFPDLNYGTSYLGFNLIRQSTGWKTDGNGAQNGGALIYGTINGRIYLSPLASTGGNDQTGISDLNILEKSVVIYPDGMVSIGVPAPVHKLEVAGTVRACRFIAEANAWCDYVFDENYKPMSILELEDYLKKERHLPSVPSETQIYKNGVDLAAMDASLLKALEENTLYIIELKKENLILKEEAEKTTQRYEELLKRIELLEKSINEK